ncbi:unnamed protein product [Clonostachys byssicola]|uniref:2EXR domain-containing protein n=1 Tax=Clonostachys byssicola TaxID=160290 RepID=A0A9N9XYF9_9HYPO|nr:unnamed protein product [Clonostachys byssicola]
MLQKSFYQRDMEEYQPRFPTLNRQRRAEQQKSAEASSFHLFPRLPAEVRLRIWESALSSRRRLFTVRLRESSGTSGGYSLSVEQPPRISPLVRTCHESRQAVWRYFRLPIRLENSKTLWIAPESDHLFLPKFSATTGIFVNFVNDLRAADPNRVGLLHVAFDGLCDKTLASLKALAPDQDIPGDALDTFKACVARLESVWFVHLLHMDSRVCNALLSGTRNRTIMGYNRSMPIFPHAVEFELLGSDPRPIESSLKGQTVWNDPKTAVQAWVKMERKLGFHNKKLKGGRQPSREISHLLAMTARNGYRHMAPREVDSEQTMDEFLQRELDMLKEHFVDGVGSDWPQFYHQEVEEGKEYLLSAAGFWVFPLGTFKTVDKSHKTAVYKDLSGLHPGIGLFNL